MSNDEKPAGPCGSPLTKGLGPLVETAWLYENDGGARVLHTNRGLVRFDADMRAAQAYPDTHSMTTLYALTPEDVAAANKARKEAAWKALRRLDLCRCDHNEYCGHCYPVEFRPGGVWAGGKV
jgi:hypothetical protein